MSEDSKEKKDYCYICDGKVLKNDDGLSAKAKKEAEDLFTEIQNTENLKDDQENEDIKTMLFNAFKKGPLHWKPEIKTDHKNYFQTGRDSFNVQTKTELKDSITHEYESYKHKHGHIDAVDAGAADFSFAGVYLARGEYAAKLEGSCKASYCGFKEEKQETNYRTGNIYAGAKCEINGTGSAKGKIGLKKYSVSADADGTVKAKGDCSFLGMETRKYKKDDEKGFDLKCVHAKAQAEVSVKGKASANLNVGDGKTKKVEGELEGQASGETKFKLSDLECSKTSNNVRGKFQALNAEAKGQASFRAKGSVGEKMVEAKGKAQGEASVKMIDGKMLLSVKKDSGRIHIPGVQGTVGQAKAKAEASVDIKTGSDKDAKKFGAKGEAEFTLAKMNSCKVDIRKKKTYGNMAKMKCNSTLFEANIGTASVIGKKEGTTVGARLKRNVIRANIGNVQVTGKDDRKILSATVQSGNSLEVGNINISGLGHKGVTADADTGPGLSVGNVSIGSNRNTGVSGSTKTSFFNLNLSVGVPKLNFNGGGGGFNFGIPFSGGGGGGETEGRRGGEKGGDSSTGDFGIKKCGYNGDYFQSEDMDSDSGNDDDICGKDGNNVSAGRKSSNGTIYQDNIAAQGNLNSEESHDKLGSGNLDGRRKNANCNTNDEGYVLNGQNVENDVISAGMVNGTSGEVEYGDFKCQDRKNYTDAEEWDMEKSDTQTLKSRQNTVPFLDKPSESKESSGVVRDRTAMDTPSISQPEITKHTEKKTSSAIKTNSATDKQKLNLKDISDYNKHIGDLLLKKIGSDFVPENTKPRKSSENKYDWSNTKKVKEDLLRACRSNTSGENGGRKGVKSSASANNKQKYDQYSGNDINEEEAKQNKPQKNEPPEKPFGANKNIHTIFTIGSGDSKPIKYLKDNLACFGDDD